MDELTARLIQIVVEKLRSNPQADVTELANYLKAAVESDPDLARLVTDSRILQINQGDARAFQTLVNGGIANVGTHVHADTETLKAALENFFQKLQAESIKSPPLTQQEYHNRQALLTKVKNFWVKDVLEKSLYNQALIELGLEKRLDAVAHPWSLVLETGDSSPELLSKGTKVIDIFDQIGAGRTLLILGEPGAGKTTALLELTRDLIVRAEQDVNHLIPVVFNLSSWAVKRYKITDWLVQELNTKYQVPKKIGQPWLEQQQLLPLLDGLDEVKAEYREQCIDALNAFHQKHGVELVVCSRIKDYEILSKRLNFQSAVYLRPLTSEQVRDYLDSAGTELIGLRELFKTDTALQELSQSPLMLNIMTLAYQGVAVEELPQIEVVEERRKQLFDDYIQKMFHRPNRSKVEHLYPELQTKYWLSWLAHRMIQESQSVFLIERMQPYFLENNTNSIYKIFIYFVFVFIFCLFFLFAGYLQNKIIYLTLSGICIGVIMGGLVTSKLQKIITVEKISFSESKLKKDFPKTMIIAFIIGLIDWLTQGEIFKGIYSALIALLLIGVMPAFKKSEIQEKTHTNQGIKNSIWNSCLVALICSLVGGLISGLINGLIIGITSAISLGLIAGLGSGGIACIQHFTLRLILYRNSHIPWNYARFLNYATDRLFLQRVGGGYRFMHDLLRQHFAENYR